MSDIDLSRVFINCAAGWALVGVDGASRHSAVEWHCPRVAVVARWLVGASAYG